MDMYMISRTSKHDLNVILNDAKYEQHFPVYSHNEKPAQPRTAYMFLHEVVVLSSPFRVENVCTSSFTPQL